MKARAGIFGLLLVATAACGLSPKPGARIVLEGDIRAIDDPPLEPSPVANDADHFYWRRGERLVSRSIGGGPTTKLAEIGLAVDLPVVTGDDVVMWDSSRQNLEIVPKGGGDVRRIPLGRRLNAGALAAVGDGVLWPERQGGEVVVFHVRTREANPAPRQVGRIAGETDIRLETSSTAYVIWTVAEEESRIYGAERAGAPLRRLYSVPRGAIEDMALTIQVGTRHVFVMKPKSSLSTDPVPLVAVPLDGTPARVIEPHACAWSLAVLGDDPLYVRARSRCPGESPEAQKLEVMRYDESGAHPVYSVYGGSVDLRAVGGRGVVIRERIPLDHPSGSAPEYQSRAALLTFP